MYLQEAKPHTAQSFVARLGEVEKMEIRRASDDRLEHLRTNDHLVDNVSFELLKDAKALLLAEYSTWTTRNTWSEQPWKF